MSQDETAGDSQSYLESVVHRVGTTELSKAVESAAIRIADAKEKERAQAIHDLTDVKKDIGQLAARVDSLTHQQSIMEEDLTSKEHVIETLTQESVEAQGKVQSLTAEVSIIQSEAKNLRRKLTLAKWLWATLVVVIGGIVLFVIPSVFPSKWLNDHPNRLGLYGCIVCIVLAVAWAIVDSKRRKFAVGTVLVGAIFVLLQIIGR